MTNICEIKLRKYENPYKNLNSAQHIYYTASQIFGLYVSSEPSEL